MMEMWMERIADPYSGYWEFRYPQENREYLEDLARKYPERFHKWMEKLARQYPDYHRFTPSGVSLLAKALWTLQA
jgi:hypothetical protein